MGNHLVKQYDDRGINLLAQVQNDGTPNNQFSKTFIDSMYNQQSAFLNNINNQDQTFFNFHKRRACCMGVVNDGSLDIDKKAIGIKMPLYDNNNDKCPLNYEKDEDGLYFLKTDKENIISNSQYEKLKLEDCLSYINIATVFKDLTPDKCKEEEGDYYAPKYEGGEKPNITSGHKCIPFMEYMCSKAMYDQGCLGIKASEDDKVRAYLANNYNCGIKQAGKKKLIIDPILPECVCVNDFWGFTLNTDPRGPSASSTNKSQEFRSMMNPYGLAMNNGKYDESKGFELDSNNKSSIYSLNVNQVPKEPKDLREPAKRSAFCASRKWNINHAEGVFQAFLKPEERNPSVTVECTNIMQISAKAGNTAELSGLNQVNNCGAANQENDILNQQDKELQKTPQKPPPTKEEQEKVNKEAEKASRTLDTKEEAIVEQGKQVNEQEKKEKEEEAKKLEEAAAKLKAQGDELNRKLAEIEAKEKKVEDIKEKKEKAEQPLAQTATETSSNLYLYLGIGGGVLILLVLVLMFTMGGGRRRSRRDDDED
jgi:hypothetical protein